MSQLNPPPEDAKISASASGSGQWMSSKMRLMRKLRNNTDIFVEPPGSNKKRSASIASTSTAVVVAENENDNTSRVCSDCNTTKTPLWRGGPQGPKSLCNACGIRQRKARKAMGVVVAASGVSGASVMRQKGSLSPSPSSSSPPSTTSSLSSESGEPLQMKTSNIPYKKRCKVLYQGSVEEKMILDDLVIGNLSRNSDVNEAAKLLMALSSDIICG